ncbi:MAG: 50S ribosomal protein L22 [Parcubacteria group bacterium GW2011_GWB1_46_8]|nr:MAG: 50S ribosomal protein L22 [Parcubacteria group bacterium GW2011_GWF1_45_5]KKU44105.1 MAG: 50S ribosomal protein L22 [Parcubacteria group bacterium GW2011_GWA2_46_7]KKU46670.1 MAG: 50S ribosomal protein L22 [Parcubacteria group bacterium GW2011_GWB1_46_8]KKU47152.1 MAG: 50S ribosomal protein L22 [Parcubacteria group bacterium GW2011_GWF2_46_8]
MNEIRAQLKYLRIAPKKVRRIASLLKGMGYADALAQLKYLPQRSAQPLYKLIRSAGANAKHNIQTDPNTLSIIRVLVDPGPSYKRMRPRAHGAGFPIAKRMSHITIYLGVRSGKRVTSATTVALSDSLKEEQDSEKSIKTKQPRISRSRMNQKEKSVSVARRRQIFNRKAI